MSNSSEQTIVWSVADLSKDYGADFKWMSEEQFEFFTQLFLRFAVNFLPPDETSLAIDVASREFRAEGRCGIASDGHLVSFWHDVVSIWFKLSLDYVLTLGNWLKPVNVSEFVLRSDLSTMQKQYDFWKRAIEAINLNAERDVKIWDDKRRRNAKRHRERMVGMSNALAYGISMVKYKFCNG